MQTEFLDLRHGDCMEGMSQFPDNHFDLAIVDPPYGLGDRLEKGGKRGGMGSLRNLADSKVCEWDKVPNESYFHEIFRITEFQIIWGANYFMSHLESTDGLIIWDKMNGTNPMTDAELAWQNKKKTTRMFRMHHFSHGYDSKIHPTQKPVKLYKWLLKNYAESGQRILDTHLGSMSIAIACHDYKCHLTGFEIDDDYFAAGVKRVQGHVAQLQLF